MQRRLKKEKKTRIKGRRSKKRTNEINKEKGLNKNGRIRKKEPRIKNKDRKKTVRKEKRMSGQRVKIN